MFLRVNSRHSVPFTPREIRLVGFGPHHKGMHRALAEGELPFGDASVPHALCEAGDWNAVFRFLMDAHGKSADEAQTVAEDLKAFYTLGVDCLWITLLDGYLWWAFAQQEVTFDNGSGMARGSRVRKVIGTWCKTDVHGDPLWVTELGAGLTQPVQEDRRFSRVLMPDRLIRRINGIDSALLAQARAARKATIAAARDMIAELHWRDFVTMVDMIFSRSGWRRVSPLVEKEEVDLTLEEPSTARMALVQVRSRAGQAAIDEGLRHFVGLCHQEMFFVCHRPEGLLVGRGREDLHIWTHDRLADMAIKVGLYDWLLARSA